MAERKLIKPGKMNFAQAKNVAHLVEEGPEMVILFYLANTLDEWATIVAINAMHRTGMLQDNGELYPDWKSRGGLPFDWDADKYLKHGDHRYSKDPKFNPNA